MTQHDASHVNHLPKREPITFSNSVRLTGRQWLGIAAFAVGLAFFAPSLWELVEPFPEEEDYRIPNVLKQDYWFYQRMAQHSAENYDVMLIGDSVVWGAFAKRGETLSHYLNQIEGRQRYANLGLNGAHPLALEGLVSLYAGGVTGKKVVLHCNLLWLTAPRWDFSDEFSEERKAEVYHQRLIPQFYPRIPRYQEKISPRLGILISQRLPVSQWANHLQQAYYHSDIPDWTMRHPYENPLGPLSDELPAAEDKADFLQVPWNKKKAAKEDFPWIRMETSLQWPAFQRVVQILLDRGNQVFVLVGPFNEHKLTAESKERCQKVKDTIAAWLKERQVPHVMAEVLPSEQYGDASHPLPAGYELLARRLLANAEFVASMNGDGGK